MNEIKQKRGEAELAVVDWLINLQPNLTKGDAAVSIISSGDIDAVLAHILAVSTLWARDSTNKFVNPVHVVLNKGQVCDVLLV